MVDDAEIPDFKLEGAAALLRQALDHRGQTDGTFRMVASDDQAQAIADGTLDLIKNAEGHLTGQLRNSKGQFAGAVGFAASAGVLTGPQAAVALLTITALTELGAQLHTAFSTVSRQLAQINKKLDANFAASVMKEFSQARTSYDTAVEAERLLRGSGRLPASVDIGQARFNAISGWDEADAHVHGLERSLRMLGAETEHAPRTYLEIIDQALAFGPYELSARVALLAAWGVARVRTETVHRLMVDGADAPARLSPAIHDKVISRCRSVDDWLSGLTRAKYTGSEKNPLYTGYRALDGKAARTHFELIDIARDADQVLAFPEVAARPRSVLVEIGNVEGRVVTKARPFTS